MTGKSGKRRKQLMDYLNERKGYWKLTEEALDCNLRITRFGTGYGPVAILTNSAITDQQQQDSNLNSKSLRKNTLQK